MTSTKSTGKARAKRPSKTETTAKPVVSATPRRQDTKQDTILKLLKEPAGATITSIMSATGWQQHSVQGFFSAVVRKKLGLSLVSELRNGERIYQIKEPKPSKGRPSRKSESALAAQS